MRLPISRRTFLVQGGTRLGVLEMFGSPWEVSLFRLRGDEEVIPWLDQPSENPVPEVIANQISWEEVDTWITPNYEFFSMAHYNRPEIDATRWQLEVGGLVTQPMALTLEDIMARPRQELVFTLECSDNHVLPFFHGGIGNATWAGTPLAPLLEEAGVLEGGTEVVFWGADAGKETVCEQTIMQNFVRSMALADAMNPNVLLAYEMNGEPLPAANGFPLRVIAPGWYGIANVKWLERIEVWNTHLMNRIMARDSVTLRQGDDGWSETSVGQALLKSAPARAVRTGDSYRIDGAAWGAPIAGVDVQIDGGEWRAAALDATQQAEFAWTFWSLNWPDASVGEHTVTSRATDTAGNVQPAPDDPSILNKITYWASNGQITHRVMID